MKTIKIIDAKYFGNGIVEITFNDKHFEYINVSKFIKDNPHPQYNKYLDEKKAKQFKLENGNIVWGKNWDLVFAINDIYSGKLN